MYMSKVFILLNFLDLVIMLFYPFSIHEQYFFTALLLLGIHKFLLLLQKWIWSMNLPLNYIVSVIMFSLHRPAVWLIHYNKQRLGLDNRQFMY